MKGQIDVYKSKYKKRKKLWTSLELSLIKSLISIQYILVMSNQTKTTKYKKKN